MKKVIIIDYGVGNIMSLKMAFNKINIDVKLTRDVDEILSSKYIVLPGVGAYASAMKKILEYKLDECLRIASKNQKYILGICLGAQLLLNKSEEFGDNKGLELIPGEVKKIFDNRALSSSQLKLPHIGWSKIVRSANLEKNQEKLLNGLSDKDSFYFIHSYACQTKESKNEISHTLYENIKIPAIIAYNNIFGCQFHPEKSGKAGLKLLKNFLSIE